MDPPPRRADRLVSWLLLLLCLVVVLPAMLLEIQQPDAIDTREARALATSVHTYHRWQAQRESEGFIIDLVVPSLNGQKLRREPPGVTWAHMAVFAALSPEGPQGVDRQVYYARLSAVLMALLLLGSVYWAGQSIDGMKTAFFAALICAANPFFIYHARVAAPPIYAAAWLMLAIAAALWAIRPLRPAPSVERQFIGWTTCGLAMGAAVLTLGPLALPIAAGAVLLILLMCPDRTGHLMGLIAALLFAVLLVFPWALYVQEHDGGAWQAWAAQLDLTAAQGPAALVGDAARLWLLLLVALLPWTVWLVAALLQPFSTSSAGSRNRLFLGWSLFVFLMALMPIIARQRSDVSVTLLVMPAAALLMAQLFHRYSDLAAEGRHTRLWRLLRWPHLALLFFVSLGVPLFLAAQPALVSRGVLDKPLVGNPGWVVAAGLVVALMALVFLGLRWMLRDFPDKALVAWACWTLALLTVVTIPLTRSPLARSPLRYAAHTLDAHSGSAPVYWLRDDAGPGADDPDPALLLYANRDVRPITAAQLTEALAEHGLFYIVAESDRIPAANVPTLRQPAMLSGDGMVIYRVQAQPAIELQSSAATAAPPLNSEPTHEPDAPPPARIAPEPNRE